MALPQQMALLSLLGKYKKKIKEIVDFKSGKITI
jgi:hypothetical protein